MSTTPAVDPWAHTWLELGEARRLLIDACPRLVMGLDLEGRILWINEAGARSLGYASAELEGRALIGSLVRPEEVEARASALADELGTLVPLDGGVFSARLRQGLADEHAWTLVGKDGEPRPATLALGTLRDPGAGVTGLIVVERETTEEAPIALRHHDALTGLPARALLQDRAEMAMQRAARVGTRIGLLLVELEGFERLCAERGATFGDDLLRATAGRLHFELRKTDTAVRLPGGRFVAMLVDLRQGEEARLVADKIEAALQRPVNTGVELLHPRCRIGVAVYPDDGDQLLPLLEAAERALPEAPRPPQDGSEGTAPQPAADGDPQAGQ